MSFTEPITVATDYAWSAHLHLTNVVRNFEANPPHIIAAKGDIPVATGEHTVDILTVGTDTQMLESRASETTGRKWVNSGLVPIGGILIWSGAAAAIPTGWQLCNGTNGTPDLRDKFVYGAVDNAAIGATGGAATIDLSHSHSTGNYTTETGGAHTHTQADIASSGAHTHDIYGSTQASVFSHLGTDVPGTGRYAAPHPHSHVWPDSVTDNDGAHTHTKPETESGGGHTHDLNELDTGEALSTAKSTLPPYYALCYVMRMS